MNNSPYHGSTHHADMTLGSSRLFRGETDILGDGFVPPRRYRRTGPYDVSAIRPDGLRRRDPLPLCSDRGANYKPIEDVIRIGVTRNRVPDLWLGDLNAQIGACKTAERRLVELMEKYGLQAIEDFIEDWFDYGAHMATEAIRKLPAGTYKCETRHDPAPGVADDGIPVRVTVTVDSEEGMITIDVRDNIDNVPGGLNLTENTCTGSCRMSVFNNLSADMPHNHGSASWVKVLMREGSVIGKPRYPVGTSVATTNVNDRLISAGSCAFSGMGAPYGQAEGDNTCRSASAWFRDTTRSRIASHTSTKSSSPMQAVAHDLGATAGLPIAVRPMAA